MKTRDNYKTLKGIEKAAVFMLSLKEDQIKKIFSLMDENEIKELSQVMATLGKINSKVVDDLADDFTEQLTHSGNLVGSYENTEKLLSRVLTQEKANTIMEEIRGPAGRTTWDKLSNVNEEVLATYLKNEYPQTVAIIMTKIRPENASRILTLLPENMAMEVVMRILKMENVQKEIIDDIEQTLRLEFMSNLVQSNRRDQHEVIAEVFNFFDRTTEARFLSSLEERNTESAERVKSLMFTFEDLLKVEEAGIQTIIRLVDKAKLAMALKGANDEIKDIFFKNMSERSVKLMKEDMQALGMVRVKEVEEAQSTVVMLTKELANRNEIKIRKKQEDEEELIG